jgi:RNA polymerase sigma factor (sigma-70 family)
MRLCQIEISEVGSVPSENDSSTRHSLLLRVRDFDDSEAWQDFVDIYAPRIFVWCKGLGLQDVDASDAAQTVLLKLVNTIRDFEYDPAKGSFRSWLKTIAYNTANDIHRNWRHRGAADSAVAKLLDTVPDEIQRDSLADQIEQAYRDELLSQASSRVKLRVKSSTWQAYRRSMIDHIPAAKVAAEIGLSIADVYVAKSRVIKMLREEVRRLDPQAEFEN